MQPSSQSGLGPRIWSEGRRARSMMAVAVRASSTAAEARISPCWAGVRSLHRLFDVMIHSNPRDRPGVTADCPSLPSLLLPA